MKNNLLTVNVITYNHKPYIAKCLDSLLEQETDFGFIIRVFDDCSTDGTTEICREYAEKHPNKIFFYPTEKNLGVIENPIRAYSNIETPYYMLIEGDDYSCGQGRFQRQVKILEEHPECSFCAAKTMTNFVHGESRNGDFPVLQTGIYSLEEVLKSTAKWGQFNTHIASRIVRTKCIILDKKHPQCFFGDITQEIELLRQGPMYFVDECFCVYNLTGTGIWSEKTTFKKISYLLKNLEEYDEYTKHAYHSLLIDVFCCHARVDLSLDTSGTNVLRCFYVVKKKKTVKNFIKLFIPPIVIKIIHGVRDVIRFIKLKQRGELKCSRF